MTSEAVAEAPCSVPDRPKPLVVDAVVLEFEEVYERHVDFIWRVLRRLGVPEAAIDDVVQDAFVVVHRRLASFEGRSSIKTWLFAIAYRTVGDHRRATKRRGAFEELPAELADDRDGPGESLERKRSLELLDKLLATLDDEKRAVLTMVEIEELSVPEAAEALGIKVNTAYSRLRAARREFELAIASVPGDFR